MKHQIIISKDLCIGCGICVRDCVANNLHVENGTVSLRSDSCIFCGHCEAVCPKGAISLTGFSDIPEEIPEPFHLDPEDLLQHIRTRRTIRSFTDAPVEEDVIEQIIEAGRLAPTGGNAQNISYILLDKRKDEFEALGVKMFRKVLAAGKSFSALLRNMDLDDHFFFKKAPLVILIVSSNAVNASLAAENMAFMAEANGLGVLYSGFFTMVANHNRTVRKALELRRGQKVITTLVIGHPAVRYHRTARREEADVKKL